jgi:hypothetical protein
VLLVVMMMMMMMMIFLFLTFWLFCPAPDLPDDGCYLFLPLMRFVLFFLHFEGIVAPLFRFVSSSEPVSYEYQN